MADVKDLGNNPTPEQIMAQAEREVAQELVKDQVAKLKRKLKERNQAKQLLANLDREIEALKLEVKDVLGE